MPMYSMELWEKSSKGRVQRGSAVVYSTNITEKYWIHVSIFPRPIRKNQTLLSVFFLSRVWKPNSTRTRFWNITLHLKPSSCSYALVTFDLAISVLDAHSIQKSYNAKCQSVTPLSFIILLSKLFLKNVKCPLQSAAQIGTSTIGSDIHL